MLVGSIRVSKGGENHSCNIFNGGYLTPFLRAHAVRFETKRTGCHGKLFSGVKRLGYTQYPRSCCALHALGWLPSTSAPCQFGSVARRKGMRGLDRQRRMG